MPEYLVIRDADIHGSLTLEEARRLSASISQKMVLVPRIPTKEMIEAAWAAELDENAAGVWKAMIEAFDKIEGAHE